jgi:hypothetical protein
MAVRSHAASGDVAHSSGAQAVPRYSSEGARKVRGTAQSARIHATRLLGLGLRLLWCRLAESPCLLVMPHMRTHASLSESEYNDSLKVAQLHTRTYPSPNSYTDLYILVVDLLLGTKVRKRQYEVHERSLRTIR